MEKLKDKFAVEIEDQKVKKRLRKARAELRRDIARKHKEKPLHSLQQKSIAIKLPKAVLRISKLKSNSQIKAAQHHIYRVTDTPNADPCRTSLNQTLIGTEGDLYGDFLRAVGDRKMRKNGVRMVEHLLTVSPEYFRPDAPEQAGTWNQERLDRWIKQSIVFLKKEYGTNCIHAICHVDEASCHIHAYQLPLDYSKDRAGKLNASHWFNGKQKLSALQDRYADAMKPLGITRGIKKSKAKHTDVKQFYSAVNSSEECRIDDLRDEYVVGKPLGLKERLTPEEYAQREVDQALESQARKFIAQSISQSAKAEAYSTQVERLKDMERTYHSKREQGARARAEYLREIPLKLIMKHFGFQESKNKDKAYETPIGKISIKQYKFFNHRLCKGGGGAIDLVMHLEACDYNAARDYLAAQFDWKSVVSSHLMSELRASQSEINPKSFIMPAESTEYLQTVKAYLCNDCGLDQLLIEALIKRKDLYADQHANAVFVCRDFNGVVTGAEKIGTRLNEATQLWRGLAKGSDTASGLFVAEGNSSNQKINSIVIVESPVEALSYVQLHPSDIAISSAGYKVGFIKHNLKELLELSNYNLKCAWRECEEANQEFSKSLKPLMRIERLILGNGMDWNEMLKLSDSMTDGRNESIEKRGGNKNYKRVKRYRNNEELSI